MNVGIEYPHPEILVCAVYARQDRASPMADWQQSVRPLGTMYVVYETSLLLATWDAPACSSLVVDAVFVAAEVEMDVIDMVAIGIGIEHFIEIVAGLARDRA